MLIRFLFYCHLISCSCVVALLDFLNDWINKHGATSALAMGALDLRSVVFMSV